MLLTNAFIVLISIHISSTAVSKQEGTKLNLTVPMAIKFQYPEMSTVVLCYDLYTTTSLVVKEFTKKTQHKILLVDYTKSRILPEDTTYFYVLFFGNHSNLKYFMTYMSYKVQVLLILTENDVLDVVNVSKTICCCLKVYIFDLHTTKLTTCSEQFKGNASMENIDGDFPMLVQRDVSDFYGRRFNVGTTMFPTRLEYE